jgi:hypothetical protein
MERKQQIVLNAIRVCLTVFCKESAHETAHLSLVVEVTNETRQQIIL